jgi:hypothetical protein
VRIAPSAAARSRRTMVRGAIATRTIAVRAAVRRGCR